MDVAFIEAMLKEQNVGNRPNETFSPQAYTNIVKALSDKFNTTFKKDNLKNRIKTLKKYFTQFHDVFQGVSLSGYAWNPSTKLIEVEDDVWEALKKDKPDIYELKTKQVNCYDEMYALWKKDRATSAYTQTAKEKKNRLNNDQQAEAIDEIDHLYENNEINLDNIGTRKDIHVTSPTPQSDAKLPTI
ncbi:Myb/SANT-like domain-containing protein [Tanacetum coccineum]